MKKLFYLFMVALCATMFSACSDDDKDPVNEEKEGGEGVITMITIDDHVLHLAIHSFKEGEIITVDWGDGTSEVFKTVLDEEYNEISYWTGDLKHKYSNSNPHIITIEGNIKKVNCQSDKLTSLDVSKCTKLTKLDCHNNNLTSLDVSGCPALIELDCDDNKLISLDVSKCTKLTKLDCHDNNLTSLDISKNTALIELNCDDNKLISLDVSECTKLTKLDCYNNNLTSLDISKNTALIELDCGGNKLISLDVSNTKLTFLTCRSNNLSTEALNKILTDLPVVTSGIIYIGDNSGTNTCDRSIAEKKGWIVENYWY